VYDIEIFDAAEIIKKRRGHPSRSWRPVAPDQVPFIGSTLDDVFASLG
jgi:hypothetical protein